MYCTPYATLLTYYTAGATFRGCDSYNSHIVRLIVRGVPHYPTRNSVVFNLDLYLHIRPIWLSIGYIVLDLYITFPLYIYILHLQRKHNGGNSFPSFKSHRSSVTMSSVTCSFNAARLLAHQEYARIEQEMSGK